MKATIWHNPRCSKSRETLAILQDSPGIDLTVIEYLKTVPTRDTLARLYQRAGITPRDALRKGEPLARDMHLAAASDDDLLDAMAAHPILIERPLVETDKGVVIARPPATVRSIL